jgi:hypothetical protein
MATSEETGLEIRASSIAASRPRLVGLNRLKYDTCHVRGVG